MDKNNSQRPNSFARMSEQDFKKHWYAEKHIYDAWGDYVVHRILKELESQSLKLDSFLKIPAKHRLKDDASLIDKAFYRINKKYTDPYNEIEDKVGARFVVLLLEDIDTICRVIDCISEWHLDACKHFEWEREENPLYFTYQSVHYIVRPSSDFEYNGLLIPSKTACEVQIRTLLQHAHAELTHDKIYKATKDVKPKIHRTVAKCMALIETTDDFFKNVSQELSEEPLQKFSIINQLDNLYFDLTGVKANNQKSAQVILDEFEEFVDEMLIDNIQKMIKNIPHIDVVIKNRIEDNVFYRQSITLFVYWLFKKKKRRLIRDWPLSKEILVSFAADLGISMNN